MLGTFCYFGIGGPPSNCIIFIMLDISILRPTPPSSGYLYITPPTFLWISLYYAPPPPPPPYAGYLYITRPPHPPPSSGYLYITPPPTFLWISLYYAPHTFLWISLYYAPPPTFLWISLYYAPPTLLPPYPGMYLRMARPLIPVSIVQKARVNMKTPSQMWRRLYSLLLSTRRSGSMSWNMTIDRISCKVIW